MGSLDSLLGATLILVAHPDDEIIVCGSLMQKMRKAWVVFATDGAPRDESFWRPYGSRRAYAEVRKQEAQGALAIVGARPIFLADRVPGGIVDQELFQNLAAAVAEVGRIAEEMHADCILTLAYEGGHPDHDAACFVGASVSRSAGIPAWESPLYHRAADGAPAVQKFPSLTTFEVEVSVEGEALARKNRMFEIYKSQNLVLDRFYPERETFRPMYGYDFTQPPLPWKLNYEIWEWKMTGREVSAAFARFLESIARSAVS
jgi:N-acetylglucosamine malate deacetylase 2